VKFGRMMAVIVVVLAVIFWGLFSSGAFMHGD
jgi:hypothetical protein